MVVLVTKDYHTGTFRLSQHTVQVLRHSDSDQQPHRQGSLQPPLGRHDTSTIAMWLIADWVALSYSHDHCSICRRSVEPARKDLSLLQLMVPIVVLNIMEGTEADMAVFQAEVRDVFALQRRIRHLSSSKNHNSSNQM